MATASTRPRKTGRFDRPGPPLPAMRPPGDSEGPEAVSTAFVRGYAPLWLIGAGFLWWPLLVLRALRARRSAARPDLWPGLVAALLLLSLLGAALTGASLGRVAGASYNVTVWLALTAVTVLWLDVEAVTRGVAQLAGLQSVAVLAALAVHPQLSGVRLPAAYVTPTAVSSEPAFESFMTMRLVMQDYFGADVLRALGLFGNATWAGALAALGLLVSLRLISTGAPAARTAYGLLAALDAITLYLSYSRNTWLALGLALLAMGAVVLHRGRRWHALTVAGVLTGAAAVYVVTSVDLRRVFADFNSVREGSLGSRTAIYTATWQGVQDLWFPLLGHGVKDRAPGLVASLGTHSGYLGTLYRGGWLALAALVVWLVVLAVRSWRAGSPLAMGATVFAAVWFVAEDIDAGHLAPLALVLALAAIGRPSSAAPSQTQFAARTASTAGGGSTTGTGPRDPQGRWASRPQARKNVVHVPRA